jgi:hypothetical protein
MSFRLSPRPYTPDAARTRPPAGGRKKETPMNKFDGPVVLTVRGTLVPSNLEAARPLHNETAGSERGIAAARALGDLSHKVYAPCLASKQSSAKKGELLFIDRWVDPKGIMDFFSSSHVQEQASRMFSAKDATIWMPARGSFASHLPAPMGKDKRFVGMIRGPIKSPEATIEVFRGVDEKAQRDARRRGLMSHEIFIKLAPPGDTSALELLGIDVWCDFDGMSEHYTDQTHMAGLGTAFTGPPQATVWEQAPGQWSEW